MLAPSKIWCRRRAPLSREGLEAGKTSGVTVPDSDSLVMRHRTLPDPLGDNCRQRVAVAASSPAAQQVRRR
ncbi:hypothetical protein GCM10009738_41830 [Kitasatospora viridis]